MAKKKSRFYTRHVIEKTLKHHIIEWGATALSLAGAVLNANRLISGFYLWTLANILWVSFAWKHKHWGLVLMNVVYLCINAYAIYTWINLD